MIEETVEQDNHQSSEKEKIENLEESLAQSSEEVTNLKKTIGELEQLLGHAVGSYKNMVIQANPEITQELIAGDSITTINESLEKARSLVGKVRKSVEKEMSRARVPVGSPGRRSPDISSLSPREKINYGIGGKQ